MGYDDRCRVARYRQASWWRTLVNDGVHVIRMRWGKVTSLHAYLDTEILALAFRKMAAEGIGEAAADPIRD